MKYLNYVFNCVLNRYTMLIALVGNLVLAIVSMNIVAIIAWVLTLMYFSGKCYRWDNWQDIV